jgi:DNA-binding NarL/FixJ family response regulator
MERLDMSGRFESSAEASPRPLGSELCVGAVAGEHVALDRIAQALQGPAFRLLAVCFDVSELLVETRDLDLDAVVCNCADPSSSLLATVDTLCKRLPETRVVAVTRKTSTHELRRALDMGLSALVLESQLRIALATAVQAACAGQLSIPREARPQIYGPALSHRERQAVSGVAAGLTNREIAAQLHLSESTVKGHLAIAFTKLGVGSREEAAAAVLDARGSPVLASGEDGEAAGDPRTGRAPGGPFRRGR